MPSPQLLELLRLWWREGKRRGVMLPQGWLCPGRNALAIIWLQSNRNSCFAYESKKAINPCASRIFAPATAG
jgi:integrase/recombinase XerD